MMVAPAKHATRLQLLGQRFDDDLFGVVDLIDHQPELPVAGLQHDNVDGLARRRCAAASFSSRLR